MIWISLRSRGSNLAYMFVHSFTDHLQINQEEWDVWKKITDEDKQYKSNYDG
jgi:hypothetical protein